MPKRKHSSAQSSPARATLDLNQNRFLEQIEPAHTKVDEVSQELVLQIWRDKYRWNDERTTRDTFERVARAIYAQDSVHHMQEAYEAMCAGLWMPGGRIIAGAGTTKRVTLMNCLSGDTLFPTKEYGTITLEEASRYDTITVLTRRGWIEARVKCFGIQPLNKIVLSPSRSKYRKATIYATPDHRWIRPYGGETTKLRVGDRVTSCAGIRTYDERVYREGFFHGIVFGDGQLHRITQREVLGGYPLGTFHHVLRACGRVTKYYDLLDQECSGGYKQPPAAKGDRIYYHHGAYNLKDLPSVSHRVSADYMCGFIDGWWVADGHYENGNTQRCISSTNYAHLDWLIQHAQLGGYIITGDKIIGKKVTNLGIAKDPCRAVTILAAGAVSWEVKEITPIGIQKVYCAIVPKEHAFCLAEGVYTGNCYVNDTIQDSLDDIMKGVSNAALVLQQGGGIGTDFSTLRPSGAILSRTGSQASGPLPFMDMWHSMSDTIMSAGHRRGAMMGTLCDTHPDLPKFITAKQQKGRLTNFNVSILISDAFMAAVDDDEDWILHFPVEPKQRPDDLEAYDFYDDEGQKQFAYSVWRARDLWESITRNTYDWSEPGVIFIDRINDLNNLKYCEQIRCTNPCVSGDTHILTDKGHVPIVERKGLTTKVWNGKQFSEVTPFSTGINPLVELTFSHGVKVRCTPYHEWNIKDQGKIKTTDLWVGAPLAYFEMPMIREGIVFTTHAYSQGFYAGDGNTNDVHSAIYSPKYSVIPRLKGHVSNTVTSGRGDRRNWYHGRMLPKDFVPINGRIDYCIDWLAGLLDADACLGYPGGKGKCMPVVQLGSKDKPFLLNVRLMLIRLGVIATIISRRDGGKKIVSGVEANFADTYMIVINGGNVWKLYKEGLKTSRLDLSWVRKPKGRAFMPIKVAAITPVDPEETFCFTEPFEHMGVFNGIPGGNCGEQPLPPHGTCNLGAINLSRLVVNPFTPKAQLNTSLLQQLTRVGIRFLDNVIEATRYPLEAQEHEEKNKRRLGLGVSGLGDCLAQLNLRYGSQQAVETTELIHKTICLTAYDTSVKLAEERGPFPWFKDATPFLEGFAGKVLDKELQSQIQKHGIRNGVLLTVAPTGTTSILYGNISSGIEPTFAHTLQRKVRMPDGSLREYNAYSYTQLLYNAVTNQVPLFGNLPNYCVTAEDLTIEDHIVTQAAVQRWVDASVSKTINVAKDVTYEEFKKVYDLAYTLGCKGCTTYRPSDVRGSILSVATPASSITPPQLSARPELLHGITHKVKWPSMSSALYVTINRNEEGAPFEVFFNSKDARSQEWMTALSLMISAILRKGDGDVGFIADELGAVHSIHDTAWIKMPNEEKSRFFGSLIAYVGYILGQDFKLVTGEPEPTGGAKWLAQIEADVASLNPKEKCPICLAPGLLHQEGCTTCPNCGYSNCG
jgi:ribonucleoside-diphosphate reductase alpha chain